MKRTSKSIHTSNDILEALSESLFEINTQFNKVQQLKCLLEDNNRKHTPPLRSQGSYAAKYKETTNKHTKSMKSLPDALFQFARRTPSKPELNEKSQIYNYQVLEEEETEYFIKGKEKEIKIKAEKSRTEERKLKELEHELSIESKNLENIEKTVNKKKKILEKQIIACISKNILYDIILNIQSQGTEKKKNNLIMHKAKMKNKMIEINASLLEIERLKANIEQEVTEYHENLEKLNSREAEIDNYIQKIHIDSKTLQKSKQDPTLKVKEDQIKIKENACIDRLKVLNQKKSELEIKEQKLELREKNSEMLKSTPKIMIKDEASAREKKLMNKEKYLKELEEKLIIEEQDIENKRKEAMEK